MPISSSSNVKRWLVGCGALRLSVDEWHIRLFGSDVHDGSDEAGWSLHNDRHAKIEVLLLEAGEKAFDPNVDVILDFGFWSRSERHALRTKAYDLGAGFKIHFVDVPMTALFERIRSGNADRPVGTFHIPAAKLKEWILLFETPLMDELMS